ncbi:MAG: phospho-sugar mutase [Ruminococcaceae bacterium]|nr:phospho-sugar mutase [Oscillospiraceae bacterium]
MGEYDRDFSVWLEKAIEDPDLTEELLSIQGNEDEIMDRFYRELAFGTGGLRGVIGAGENRMNIYTVRRATQGLADYLNAKCSAPSVAISFDSRIKSDLFAKEAARVLAGNGIRVHIFDTLQPTPVLSFAVRYFKCDGGLMLTASHNPAKYNGYKCYGADGCQMTDFDAGEVTKFISKVRIFDDVKLADFSSELISHMGSDVLEAFYDAIMARRVYPGICAESGLKLVYTPLNGTGNVPVREILSRLGLNDVTVVKEQEMPDGNFPTVPYPNPEIPDVFVIGKELAASVDADMILATDPDCDRLGIAVRDSDGSYKLMTGNEVGCLLLNYVLEGRTEMGTLPKDPVAVTTIVSSEMSGPIADKYGCEVRRVLTGFKYIGEQIGFLEAEGHEERFVFGFEESYGYMAGGYVRDKDGVVASMLICEAAAYYKSKGLTLLEQMQKLYDEFGAYRDKLINTVFEGAAGMTAMAELMASIRREPPTSFGPLNIVSFADYKNKVKTNLIDGSKQELTLPSSNVLAFVLEDGSDIIIRPSGTEPKIKVYILARAETVAEADEKVVKLTEAAKILLK